MSRLFKWIKRQADNNLVTYSRFGLPGDETDDRPPPTVIHVAPFNDDAPEFLCLRMHSQLGLLMFAFFGCAVHYYVLYGIRKSQPLFLVPFIVIYTVTIAFECLVFFFTAYHWSSQPYSYRDPWAQPGGSTQHAFAALVFILIFFGGAIIIQGVMLQAVIRCRNYLCRRRIHQAELAVAEKSKSQHPGLRVVFGAGDTQQISLANGGNAFEGGNQQQGSTSDAPPAYPTQSNEHPPAPVPTRTLFSSVDETEVRA